MLCLARVAAEGAGCPRRSDIKAGQTGSLACYIIIARPAIIRYSLYPLFKIELVRAIILELRDNIKTNTTAISLIVGYIIGWLG
jgi:hypothetical protein